MDNDVVTLLAIVIMLLIDVLIADNRWMMVNGFHCHNGWLTMVNKG